MRASMIDAPAPLNAAAIRKNSPGRSGANTDTRVAPDAVSGSAATDGTGSPIRASAAATVGQAPRMGARCGRLPGKPVRKLLLPHRDQFRPPALLVAQAKPFLGGIIEGAKQLPLPVIPCGRTDGANVDDGQDQQQPQPLRALNHPNEILDRLWVRQVAAESGVGQQQMMTDQPGDRLRLLLVQSEARA